jgi:hypothetical protein
MDNRIEQRLLSNCLAYSEVGGFRELVKRAKGVYPDATERGKFLAKFHTFKEETRRNARK